MAESMYGSYDEFYADHPFPIQLGGLNRAKSAFRDKQGRFMPNSAIAAEEWHLAADHGVKGGQARARKAVRDQYGRFVKAIN